MYVHKLKAGLDKQGNITAWQHRIVGQSIAAGTVFDVVVKDGIDPMSVEGAVNLPYSIPNLSVELHTVDLPVPVLWWRSVGSTHTAHATEVFIDQLAAVSQHDPLAFRLKLLKDHPKHQSVLQLAAGKAGWGGPLPKGRARGIAVHQSFRTTVAQVAEIQLGKDGDYRVEKVTCAVDCGLAINPDVIVAQMEGGIGFGLSPVLLSEITFKDGKVVQSSFHDYQVVRMPHMPKVDVHIVPSTEPPTGVGEPATPVIAPAVENALHAATGVSRVRLPFGLKV
jgi:isoquinoline 1-oxidoreductase beta subunit